MKLCGMRALNAYSRRCIRFVRLDKGRFIGRDAARRILADQPKRKLAVFAVGDGDVDPVGNEPILSGAKWSGD
jgi:glycine cleavage system aminomethyltransferase T